jgi:drug/metabolite transporter (DMT)-like permease
LRRSATVPLGPFRLSPAAAGAAFCLVAILGYGTANVCMRKLSESCLSSWAIFNKELVTVVVVGPWLAWRIWRRKASLPAGRPLLTLIAVGLATELIGNVGTQWGYGVVGLAVMVPANTGFVLVATAVLGAVLLGERVSARNAAVLALLIVALIVLGYGISQASVQRQGCALSPGTWQIAAAIAVAGLCGTVYALLAIALRYSSAAGTGLSATVVIITASGVLTLGPLSLWQAGTDVLAGTSLWQYALMYAAGVCNLVAFLALVRGLQLTTVLHINMLNNAGQVTLATVGGVVVFREACNGWLMLGVGLMIAAIFAFGAPLDEKAVEAPV